MASQPKPNGDEVNRKELIAEGTDLGPLEIRSLANMVFGKLLWTLGSKKEEVGRLLGVLSTAIGSVAGWKEAEDILSSPNPTQRLREALSKHKLIYPASTKIERRKQTMSEQVAAEKPAAAASGRQGRASQFTGKRLWWDGPNPTREGSKAHTTIEIIRNNPGITLEELEAKGGFGHHFRELIKKPREGVTWDVQPA